MVPSCSKKKHILTNKHKGIVFSGILAVWIIGIFFSRFLQSVATVSMSLFFLLSADYKTLFKKYFRHPLSLACFGICMVYVLSVLNTEHHTEYFSILKNKIAFLVIPLGLLSAGSLEKRQVRMLLYGYIACCLISSFWSYLHYIPDKELYTKLYEQGQVLPTLIHHVSFAVLLCICVLMTLHLLFHAKQLIEKLLLLITLVWLSYFIHLLSVRTGIVLLYTGVTLYGFSMLLYRKQYPLMMAVALGILVTAYISYQTIPTLKTKIGYTYYGIAGYLQQSDTANQVSDSRRLLSDKIGLELIRQHPLAGVGIGDLQAEMDAVYAVRHPAFKKEVYAHIHNQYLYTAAGTGLIAGLVFMVCLLLIWFYFIREKNLLFSTIYLILLLVMLWEPFLENQSGTSVFWVVICLGFVRKKNA